MTDDVQEYYDQWTDLYDSFSTNPLVQRWRMRAVENLSLSDGDTIVDVGCGTGANAEVVVGADADVDMLCVDISERSLGTVSQKLHEQGWENVHPVRADGHRLPFNEMDACIATFSVGMFPNPVETVDRWMSLLTDDGRFCMLNVVKSEQNPLINKPIQVFTGATVPGTSLKKKMKQSVSGDALEHLNQKIQRVNKYLEDNHTVVKTERYLGGCVKLLVAEV